MKKFFAFLLCVLLLSSLSTVAFAAVLNQKTAYINGSGDIAISVSSAPKYFTFDVDIVSGSGSGIIQIQKPDGSYYQDFVEFNGDTSVTKRVYLASQGTYIIEVALSGSANVTVTVTN